MYQDCDELCFGPFDEGKWINHDISVTLDNLPPKVPNLIGR
jgi:hypothetical protein